MKCGFALKPDSDRVSRHLGEKHGLTRRARWGHNKLVHSLRLPNPERLPARQDGDPNHPYLALQRGAACLHCRFRSTSYEVTGHMLLSILSGFVYNIMNSGIIFFILGLLPLLFIVAHFLDAQYANYLIIGVNAGRTRDSALTAQVRAQLDSSKPHFENLCSE